MGRTRTGTYQFGDHGGDTAPVSADNVTIGGDDNRLLHPVLFNRSRKIVNIRIIPTDRAVDMVVLRCGSYRIDVTNLYFEFWLEFFRPLGCALMPALQLRRFVADIEMATRYQASSSALAWLRSPAFRQSD